MEVEVLTVADSDESQLTSDDRRIQISEFIKETGWEPEQENALVELEEHAAQMELHLLKPNIKSLLTRKLLEYDFIIPHITTEGDLDVELDFPKPAIHKEYGQYVIPAGEKFTLIEFQHSDIPTFMSEWNRERRMFITKYPWDPTNDSRYQSGALTYYREALTEPLTTPQIQDNLFEYLTFMFQYNQSVFATELIQRRRASREISIRAPIEDSGITINPLASEKEREFFDRLEKIYNVEFSHIFMSGIYEDLLSLGLLYLYQQYIILGLKSIKFDTYEAVIKLDKEKREADLAKYAKDLSQEYEEVAHAWLFRDKFNKPYETASVVQRQVIAKAFKTLRAFWKSVEANDCPHVMLYTQFRNEIDEKKINKYFAQLRKYFNNDLRDGIINCNNCGFDIMCSHVREQYELKLEHANNEVIIAKLNKYYDSVPIFGEIFCKYCGEKIANSDDSVGMAMFSGSQLIKREQAVDEVRDMIWNESNQIIRGVMIFSIIQSNRYLNNLSATIADIIYEDVKAQYELLMRSKTATLDDVKTRLKLFITIFIYALLIKISKDNHKDVKFKGNIKPDLKTIFKDAFNLLITSKQSLIGKIPGATNDFIKSYLVKAYGVLMEKYTKQVSTAETRRNDQFTALRLDPIFWHTLALKQIAAYRDKKQPLEEHNVGAIMGKTLDEISSAPHAYANVKMNFKGWVEQVADPSGKISGEKLYEYIHKLREEIVVASYKIQLDYIQNGIYLENVFIEGVINPHIAEFQDRQNNLAKREDLLADLIRYLLTRPYRFHFRDNMYRFNPDPSQLNKIYGKDGHAHKWKLFKYPSGKTLSEDEARDHKEFIVDIKCIICGELKSNPGKYDPSDVLRELHEKANFFNQYEFQCPAGGKTPYHKWNAKNVCEKCGITPEKIYNKDGNYYNKYKKVFEERLRVRSKVDINAIQERKIVKLPNIKITWKHNPGLVNQFVNRIIKINKMSQEKTYNIYYNIGLSEGYQYENIINGKVSPMRNITNDDYLLRATKLDTYARKLIHEYYFVKHNAKISRMPQDIAEIMKEIEKSKKKINFTQLPDIMNEYSAQLRQLRRDVVEKDNGGETLSNFIFDTLLETIIAISRTDIGDVFVKWFVGRLISDEENYSLLSDKEEARLTQQGKSDYYETPPAEFEVEEEYEDFDYDGSNEEDNLAD